MRTFTFAALAAIATAGRVHEFFAENNYICEACKHAVDFANNDQMTELEALYAMHPELQNRINGFFGHREVLDMNSPQKSCENMQLCSNESVFELLMAEQPLDLSAHIEAVNSNATSNWVAGVNSKFEGASLKEVKMLMGTVVDPLWTIANGKVKEEFSNADVPDTFDSRTNWPECESVINHIRDQSNCGSCWAHGTTEALNDRICISSGGTFTTLLSVSDTTGCCNFIHCASMGCNGGQVGSPWDWFKNTGVVTGGDKGDTGMCYNYTMDRCAHHVDDPSLPSCDDIVQVEPTCGKTCPDGSETYGDDKHFATSSYGFGRTGTVDKIKADIAQYGTVTSAFTVYEDFLTYKSGVYSHQTGSALGGHAIKTIGWGNEGGDDYWLCVNSWNETWGDQGTFKIKMGDSGINNQMHAGHPGQ
jgi:cathepsin B